MNAFQQQCSEAIDHLLSGHDLTVDLVEHAPATPADDGAAMFLRGSLVHGGRHYKICVYPDAAGANVGNNWYVLESQDYPSLEVLTAKFCDFLRRCLAGRHPLTALEEARAEQNTGTG